MTSDPALRIVLDHDHVTAGGSIGGALEVHATATARSDGIDVRRFWRTSGTGHGIEGGEEKHRLFSGEIVPGVHRYPFELAAPTGPVTYQGKLLSVDWFVGAVVAGSDAAAEQGFELLPGSAAPSDYCLGDGTGAPAFDFRSARQMGLGPVALGFALAFLVPVLLLGLGFTVFGILRLAADPSKLGDAFFIVWGLLFSYGPGIVIFLVLRPRLAARRLGPISFTVEPAAVRPGDMVRCEVAFTPRTDMVITSAEVTLRGAEHASRRSAGSSDTRYEHELARLVVRLSDQRELRAGEAVQLSGTLTIPADAATSFSAPRNAVSWTATLALQLPRWPDWVDAAPVVVAPAYTGRPSR